LSDKTYILGPCSIENEDVYLECASRLSSIMEGEKNWYFKGSFDKANRTSIEGGRGPGLEFGIEMFKRVKEAHPDIKLITDIHEPWQAEALSPHVDCIQVPAFLCRQTDLIVECGKHFNKINIKKGQWLGPENVIKSVDKIRETNENAEVWLTERGSSFGYYKLIVDLGIVDQLKEHYDKVILDATHSTQRNRDFYGRQGDPILAERYFISSGIFNYDGVFAETHPSPKDAVSDGDCQIPLDKMSEVWETHQQVNKAL